MAFHSTVFLSFFLPLVLALDRLMPGTRWKNYMLLLFSLVFYAFGQWQGIPVLLLSAVIAWAAGALLVRHPGSRGVLAAALALDLGLLGTFKYLDFFADSLGFPGLGLTAPLGMSFFTFKAMSYVIDVYRGGPAAARFTDALLYLSFFPQVTSGPITRFDGFAVQLADRQATPARTAKGLRRFIVGLAKKLLISAPVAAVADACFALGAGLDARTAWLGTAAYTLQLYFDFSGYSDMAIGLGAVFGFDTPENFQYPYIAASITEFWRRWHISLSGWFRDYLYIPLGGNRKGAARKALNTAVVFILCGFWHGAAWTFLLWGVWHAFFSALESLKILDCKRWAQSKVGKVFCHVYTLLAVGLGFVIFRASDMGQALEIFRGLFTGVQTASTLALCRVSPASWCALAIGAVGCMPIAPRLSAWAAERKAARVCGFAGALALFVLCLMAAAGGGFQPFIYAQF